MYQESDAWKCRPTSFPASASRGCRVHRAVASGKLMPRHALIPANRLTACNSCVFICTCTYMHLFDDCILHSGNVSERASARCRSALKAHSQSLCSADAAHLFAIVWLMLRAHPMHNRRTDSLTRSLAHHCAGKWKYKRRRGRKYCRQLYFVFACRMNRCGAQCDLLAN